MQGVVDAAAFHHQEETLLLRGKHVDGLAGHLRQARLVAGNAVQVVGHMAGREQPCHLLRAGGVDLVELGLAGRVGIAGLRQLANQVAAVGAGAARGLVLEVLAAAAEDHIDAVA